MDKIIQELKNGNDKELREHFFEIVDGIREDSETGQASFSEVKDRIETTLKDLETLVITFWLK